VASTADPTFFAIFEETSSTLIETISLKISNKHEGKTITQYNNIEACKNIVSKKNHTMLKLLPCGYNLKPKHLSMKEELHYIWKA
jgi:hypothetical protein